MLDWCAHFHLRCKSASLATDFHIVRRWIEREGGVASARAITRHVDSPLTTLDSPVQIPPALTEWLLSEFEDDDRVFDEFFVGHHTAEMYVGSMSLYFEDTEEQRKPYLNHPSASYTRMGRV